MSVDQLILAILALPLLGAFFNGVFGKNLPNVLVGSIATSVMFLSFALAVIVFGSQSEEKITHLFSLITTEDFSLNASIQVDALSMWMTLIVTGIGALIHLFSMGYMKKDAGYYKFFTYLNLFIFAMLILVLGSNYFMLFFGWEGVGICSYLLIGFHYSDAQKGMLNGIAARKAFIMNRIGDLGLLIGLFLILDQFGTLEYSELSAAMLIEANQPTVWVLFTITMCLFIGATGKSAQIPLFTWLPDAMAGPTPVSALIHAATMVTAGIFLVVRSNFFFELAPMTQEIMLYIGLVTSLVAAFIALRQNDIKKVLAYSTVSQLGLMFVALGMGAYTAAIFHVTTHAFFKALLFLGSGSVIHAMSDEQDIRKITETLMTEARGLGAAISEADAKLIAEDLYIHNRDNEESTRKRRLISFIRPMAGMIGGKVTEDYSGAALQNYQALQALAKRNGFKIENILPRNPDGTPATAQDILKRIALGELDQTRLEQDVRKLAAVGQPQFVRDLLGQGIDLEEIYAPYRRTMANILELDEGQIDLNDPTLRKGINEKGDMNLYDYEKALRQDSRWQYTGNARESVSSAALSVLRNFGFQG